jgi:hypothetical protein
MRTDKQLNAQINLISRAVNAAKAKHIRRIVKQLERMSPNDVAATMRLIGKR